MVGLHLQHGGPLYGHGRPLGAVGQDIEALRMGYTRYEYVDLLYYVIIYIELLSGGILDFRRLSSSYGGAFTCRSSRF